MKREASAAAIVKLVLAKRAAFQTVACFSYRVMHSSFKERISVAIKDCLLVALRNRYLYV